MPARILSLWLQGINSGDVESVEALYNQDAILLPTFSGQIRDNWEGRHHYFAELKAQDKIQVEMEDSTLAIQALAKGLYSASGIYSWKLFQGSKVLEFAARFTFILRPDASAPILHHHSSRIPAGSQGQNPWK